MVSTTSIFQPLGLYNLYLFVQNKSKQDETTDMSCYNPSNSKETFERHLFRNSDQHRQTSTKLNKEKLTTALIRVARLGGFGCGLAEEEETHFGT